MELCFIEFLNINNTFNSPSNCIYTLQQYEGVFKVEYDAPGFNVFHYIYAHRYYDRAIVNQFIIHRKLNNGKI